MNENAGQNLAGDGRPLVILSGPTAVGKTKLSVELAKAINGEIVSADSMQVYRHMDIGSAKITEEEKQGIPHHMIDILEPWEAFSVAIFKRKCEECFSGIYERGRIPILTGGTGFYIQAVLRDIDFGEEPEEEPGKGSGADSPEQSLSADGRESEYRLFLEDLSLKRGAGYLHDMLREADPVSAEAIHPNNLKRVIRALEYFHLTGEPISLHNKREREKPSAYNSRYFVLDDLRERIYEKIGLRVDEMMEKGLVEEVRRLKEAGCRRDMVSMQGLGYKEILMYIEGECSLSEAVEMIKRDTRHFAKRQLTWFRRERDVIRINKNEFGYDEDKMLRYMLRRLEMKA